MFLYKTFWNLYKTKYFLYKNRREFRHVFYLVGYDSLISFPSVCLFLRILLIKNLFFQNEPSFLICIYSLFVWIFSYFFGYYGRFFCPVSYPFLYFSVRLRKNLLLFFIRIIRFLRFFRFVGIIFPAFSRVELRNFSSHSRIFYASPEFFQKKNPLFRFPLPSFRHFFLAVGIIFMFFSVQGKKFFSPFSSFSRFFWNFPAEKSSFSGMNFPSERTFFPFLGEYFRIFFVSSDKEFHPSGNLFRSIRQEFSPFRLIFARSRRARTCTRVIIY